MRRDYSNASKIGGFVVVYLTIASVAGYCMNIYKLFSVMSEPLSTFIVMRIGGVLIPPVGAVLGYF